MSTLFAYICVKQSNDVVVPRLARSLEFLASDVSDAFYSMKGGFLTVGQIALFPVQQSVAYHLLCDGKEVTKSAYPELYEFLGTSQGAAVDPLNFVLPNFVGALTAAATAAPEIVTATTATSDTASSGGDVGGSTNTPVDTGGRFRLYEFL